MEVRIFSGRRAACYGWKDVDDITILETRRFSLSIANVRSVYKNIHKFSRIVLVIEYSVFNSREHPIELFDKGCNIGHVV